VIRDEHLELLACPLSKGPLVRLDDGSQQSLAGFVYRDEDFRIPLTFADDWAHGQAEYEIMNDASLSSAEKLSGFYEAIDTEVVAIYEQIPLEGMLLDVAGGYGTLRRQAQISVENYVSVDTLLMDRRTLAVTAPEFFAHYALGDSATSIQAHAEFLPFMEGTFDTVHMRSCLDHFAAPQIALFEAYRVIRPEGRLVIGIALEGAYPLKNVQNSTNRRLDARVAEFIKDQVRHSDRIYSLARKFKSKLGIGEHDHHSFHPTYDSLLQLITTSGFKVTHEVWQADYHGVLYIGAEKADFQAVTNCTQDQV